MSEKLGLDPGPGPRRRKPISICRCLCWTIGLPLFCFAAWAIISYGSKMLEEIRFPHKSLYHTEPSYNAGEVIRPLISEQHIFDIAVSVWLRAPEDEEAEYRRLRAPVTTDEPAPASSQIDFGGRLGKFWMAASLDEGNNMYRDENILERPLFSDVVFRGLRLSDKHVSAQVNFRLPTTRFLAASLTESDLRATFLLIPSSPSLIDHIRNFSSWMPDSVYAKRRPTRPWPFPLHSDERGDRTMADLALESFSISVPLLEFHAVASQCSESTANGNIAASVEATEDEGSVVKEHPYVVTRTQLRIVRETRLFNAKAYNEVRDQIKVRSCGQGIPGIRPNLRMCRRTYKSNGNFETVLELEVPKETGVETQWAYAPYLDTKAHAAGPLDIIPVPVNRENCSSAPRDTDKDYMDVSWRIAFAGRTPAKQVLGDNFVDPQLIDHRASDMMKVSQQDNAELWNGAFGHRFHDDAHPRRRVAISFVSTGCVMLAELLIFHYWWTRVSTVGISISSVVFLAAGNTLRNITDVLHPPDGDTATWVIALFLQVIPFLMCKAIIRAEFGWRKWYPTLTRVPANHRERTSQRIDGRTSWQTQLGVFAAGLAIHYLVNPDKFILIPTTGPALRPGESGPLENSELLAFVRSATSSLEFTGIFSQVLFNHRSSAYGGGYRPQCLLLSLGSVLGLSHFVPAVVGRLEWRMGLTLTSLDIILYLPLLWQAITLPPADVGDDEED
ncbi:hypothetical protein FB451DRAFT_484173 [Mycena latifolia]|nr:hypothetical protein FB451DRAFT_484173 [Mycena latifolia]